MAIYNLLYTNDEGKRSILEIQYKMDKDAHIEIITINRVGVGVYSNTWVDKVLLLLQKSL